MANRFPRALNTGFPVRDNTVGGPLGMDDEPLGLAEGSFAPTSRPSGGLSYEADIAPLQKKFFKDVEASALSGAQKNALVFGMADNMDKIRSMRQKSEMQEQQMRLRDLQYRSTLASMDDERKKRQTDHKIRNEQLPQATIELDSFIDDPNLDNNQKKEAIARWGIKNAPLLSKSPGARYAHQSAQNWVSANDVKKDPSAFASKVGNLGLDPYSPEVARMPGATPLGLQLAQQSYKRRTEKAVAAARTTAATTKATEEAERTNKRLDTWQDEREWEKPSTMSGELFEDPEGYYYGTEYERDERKPRTRIGHVNDLTRKSKRDMDAVLALAASGEETDRKRQIELDWKPGRLTTHEKTVKYGTTHKGTAQINLADDISKRMRDTRSGAGEGVSSVKLAFMEDEEEEEKNQLEAVMRENEELRARLAAAGQ